MLFFVKQIDHTPHALKYLVRNSTTHMTFFELCKNVYPDTKRVKFSKLPLNTKFVYEIHTRSSIGQLADAIRSFTEILPEIIIDKLRKEECLLLISHSHEGFPCDGSTVKKINECLKRDNIEMKNVILFCNSSSPSPHIVISREGTFCEFNYFESVARNKFTIDNIAEKNSLRFNNILTNNIKHRFLCLNRVPREHRVMFLLLLYKKNLLNNFLWSLPAIDVINGSGITKFDLTEIWSQSNIDYVFNKTKLVDRAGFSQLLPSVVDVSNFECNQWDTLNDNFMTSTGIYVVTETLFKEGNTMCFFTEKIFKPVFYKMPFMVVGTYRYLRYMRACGYKTFNNLWSEEYDDAYDGYERMLKIIEQIEFICRLDTKSFHKLLTEALYITTCNYSRLMNRSNDKLVVDFINERASAHIIL